jgi:hypothetical protein
MRIIVRFWNGFYYARAVLPDGTKVELKHETDRTYSEWKQAFKDYYDNLTPEPEPDECQCPLCNGNFVCPNRSV